MLDGGQLVGDGKVTDEVKFRDRRPLQLLRQGRDSDGAELRMEPFLLAADVGGRWSEHVLSQRKLDGVFLQRREKGRSDAAAAIRTEKNGTHAVLVES